MSRVDSSHRSGAQVWECLPHSEDPTMCLELTAHIAWAQVWECVPHSEEKVQGKDRAAALLRQESVA